MAIDTIRIKSPALDEALMRRIEQQCILRSGLDLASGEVLYELHTGELMGSWDARIAVIPKREDWVVGKSGRPQLHACEPYVLVEASAHKVLLGHNVYGGPECFVDAARAVVARVEELLDLGCASNGQDFVLPHADQWTVHRVDVASVFRMRKEACRDFFDGIQLLSFPRRQRGASKYEMAVHFAGKTTCVKLYHKGSEFKAHDYSRLRGFFALLFGHLYGVENEGNKARVERKLSALQRLADARLRVEVEVLSDKFQYDFGRNPRVEEVTDEYLQRVYDTEVERLLREGKQGMETVRTSRDVLQRLKNEYGETRGLQLYGFWTTLCTLGVDAAKLQFERTTFWRNRKALEAVGVSWRGSDVVTVANDGACEPGFAPLRSDHRLCSLPARNRPEYLISRDQLRLAA